MNTVKNINPGQNPSCVLLSTQHSHRLLLSQDACSQRVQSHTDKGLQLSGGRKGGLHLPSPLTNFIRHMM